MSTFLQALKAKSAAIHNPIDPNRKATEINNRNALIDNSVKKDHADKAIQAYLNDKNAKSMTVSRIERILNRNKLHVYFEHEVTTDAKQCLESRGFMFNPSLNCWHNQDNSENIDFLIEKFGAPDSLRTATLSNSKVSTEPEQTEHTSHSEPFLKYIRQVDALKEALKIDSADLCMLAVDCLYNKTFN